MTSYAQDHFHLYLETETFTGDNGHFAMAFQGHQFKVEPAIAAKRGLTGKLIINRLLSSGVLVKFRDKGFTTICTRTELTALELLNGMNCYYIPNWHAEGLAHDATDAYKVLPVITGKAMLDPAEQYWIVSVNLQENTL